MFYTAARATSAAQLNGYEVSIAIIYNKKGYPTHEVVTVINPFAGSVVLEKKAKLNTETLEDVYAEVFNLPSIIPTNVTLDETEIDKKLDALLNTETINSIDPNFNLYDWFNE